jgi:hypothetical protein
MTTNANNGAFGREQSRSKHDSDEIIRKLEQFPIEALEEAYRILTGHKNSSHPSRRLGAS